MVKLSFQMLLKQRKKSLNLMTVITTVLIIWMILLDFFANPMINYRLKRAFINMIDFYQLFDGMFKGTIILIVIIVSFSLIIYACNYYNKVHSKTIGLLKIKGYSNLQIATYIMIQLVIVVLLAYVLALLSSMIIIPILKLIVYRYLKINHNIFEYNFSVLLQSISLLVILFVYLALMQFNYSIQSKIPDLLKNDNVVSVIKSRVIYPGASYAYLIFYGIGILSVYSGDLGQGMILPACISAFGGYGIVKTTLAKCLKKKLSNWSIDGKKNLVLSNYLFNLQQLKVMFLMNMIVTIILSTMICVNYQDNAYFVLFMLAYILTLIILDYALVNRFSINRLNKKIYYQTLYRIGLNKQEILKISKQEILYTYMTILVLSMGYLLNLVLRFAFLNKISILLAILIILEFFIPLFFAYLITINQERRSINDGSNY